MKIQKPKWILLDIEGTTTSLSFVHEVLFPHAKKELRNYVENNAEKSEVKACLSELEQTVKSEGGICDTLDEKITILLTWIDADKKHSALKTLQGYIWEDGFERGQFLSHVYEDVAPTMNQWKEMGIQMAIYSSGSVKAQKLLFGHTVAGDLLPLLDAFFDTKVGHKREEKSYIEISSQLKADAKDVLFLSDVSEELDASKTAGMQVLQLQREGVVLSKTHEGVPTFDQISFF